MYYSANIVSAHGVKTGEVDCTQNYTEELTAKRILHTVMSVLKNLKIYSEKMNGQNQVF